MVLEYNTYSVVRANTRFSSCTTHGHLLTRARLGQEYNATGFQTSVLAGVESSVSR
jgi:hypothetical protein